MRILKKTTTYLTLSFRNLHTKSELSVGCKLRVRSSIKISDLPENTKDFVFSKMFARTRSLSITACLRFLNNIICDATESSFTNVASFSFFFDDTDWQLGNRYFLGKITEARERYLTLNMTILF